MFNNIAVVKSNIYEKDIKFLCTYDFIQLNRIYSNLVTFYRVKLNRIMTYNINLALKRLSFIVPLACATNR